VRLLTLSVPRSVRAVRLLQAAGVLQVRGRERDVLGDPSIRGVHDGGRRRLQGVEQRPAGAVLPVPRVQGRRADDRREQLEGRGRAQLRCPRDPHARLLDQLLRHPQQQPAVLIDRFRLECS
jgi:hypothetical protein